MPPSKPDYSAYKLQGGPPRNPRSARANTLSPVRTKFGESYEDWRAHNLSDASAKAIDPHSLGRKAAAEAATVATQQEGGAPSTSPARRTTDLWGASKLPSTSWKSVDKGNKRRGSLRQSFTKNAESGAAAEAQNTERQMGQLLTELYSKCLDREGALGLRAMEEVRCATMGGISSVRNLARDWRAGTTVDDLSDWTHVRRPSKAANLPSLEGDSAHDSSPHYADSVKAQQFAGRVSLFW